MRRLLLLLGRERLWLALTLLTVLGTTALNFAQAGLYTQFASAMVQLGNKPPEPEAAPHADAGPKGLGAQIDAVMAAYKTGGNKAALSAIMATESRFFILFFGGIALGALMLMGLFNYLKDLSANLLAIRVAARLRQAYFNHILTLPASFFKGHGTGDLTARSLADIQLVQSELGGIFEMAILAPLMLIGGLTILFKMNPAFTGILLLVAAVAFLVIQGMTLVLRKIITAAQARLGDLTRLLQDVVYAMDIVKIYTREDYEKKRYGGHVEKFLHQVFREHTLVKFIRPMTEFLGGVAILAILLYGARGIWGGAMALDDLLHFIIFLLVIAPYIQKFANLFVSRQRLGAALDRLEAVFAMPGEASAPLPGPRPHLSGHLVFDKVTFTYPGASRPALRDVSFSVEPGQMVALVGPSGSGKSTCMAMVPSFLRPDSGRLLFDGQDAGEIPLPVLRGHMALVSQESLLFPGSFRENIRYARLEASDAEVEAAAQVAGIHEFILARPQGYESRIGERGQQISGGQRQRLTIARAVLKHPRFLLLDEATSALDSDSERQVQAALEPLLKKQTSLVVAHRLSTIAGADRILVFEEGELVEDGSLEELKQRNGLFARLWRHQHLA